MTTMTDNDLFYLRSILRNLKEFRDYARPLSLSDEVLSDNIDWLDCFIDMEERHRSGISRKD
jgi:hypothetical protein